MLYRVKELAGIVGVSVRALHYYDAIGLLRPHSVSPAGYRLYSDQELERLQQILFFREVGFSLRETQQMLDRPGFDRRDALRTHREVLLGKRRRLDRMIETVNRTVAAIEEGTTLHPHDLFDGFDSGSMAQTRKRYAAGGFEHTVTLKTDGTVWEWGNAERLGARSAQAGRPLLSDATAVSAASGHYHSYAIRADGTVWAWGSNDHGQLGPAAGDHVDDPVQIPGLEGVVALAAGVFHALALKADGTVWSWGPNWYGQLGDGTDQGRRTPTVVPGLAGVREVAAGFFHSMALLGDGSVRRWGGFGDTSDAYPIRDASLTPITVTGLSDVAAITAGGSHGAALRKDGSVWCWGYDTEGQLGGASESDGYALAPVRVVGLPSARSLAAGGAFTLALCEDRTVWAWGSNTYGQLGVANGGVRQAPLRVPNVADVVQIAAGTKHAIAVTADGKVWTWGSDDHGQLGWAGGASAGGPAEAFVVR